MGAKGRSQRFESHVMGMGKDAVKDEPFVRASTAHELFHKPVKRQGYLSPAKVEFTQEN